MNLMSRLTQSVLALTLAATSVATAQPRPQPAAPTDAALRAAAPAEWLNYGRDYAETHFSPLNQVTTANVANLKAQWSFDVSAAGSPSGNLEATPILSNGVLYFSGVWSTVFAVDARTGQLKWKWDPQLPRTGGPRLCCGAVNRGVALYNGKVFVGLLDNRLVALDANTGQPVWDVQTSVDLKESYSITGAPRVVKGKVIIGNGGAENAVRGYFSAYDADSGKLVWRFFTVPGDPSKPFENPELEAAAKTWTGEWWKFGGGGTVWDGMAYDAEVDLLYIGTGNGGPWDRNFRSPQGGDNLYLASILAIKPDTGRMAWYFQQVPGDQWDYTTVQPLMLADLKINGRDRKVLMQAPKNGFFYVIDRITGEFISGKQYSRVTWAQGLDEKSGRPIETAAARYGKDLVTLSPGPVGAHNWQPMAFHPGTGFVYFPAQMSAFEYGIDPEYSYNKGGRNLGVIARPGALPRVEGEAPPANTWFVAWDPVAQKEVWRVNYTGGSGSGTLATAGNLVFQATPQGALTAYNAQNGTKLWEGAVGPGAATPISYELDGKQYIAILGGRGAQNQPVQKLTVFALEAAR